MKHLVLFFCTVSIFAGCGIGTNRVLFVTKTNVGFEFSNKPPTLELDVSRLEGVVEPQFEGGKTLPVLASFRFQNQGIFRPTIGSAFATGDAAVALAALYDADTPSTDWRQSANSVSSTSSPVESALVLNREPDPRGYAFQENDVRPVFFGTDTSFGVKVAWSGMTAQIPDTAKIGYNRKELALAPVTIQEVSTAGETQYRMGMPSLIATVDANVNAEGEPGLNVGYLQYFATGKAATLLALQKDVRQAMLARLDPFQDEFKKEFAAGSDRQGKRVALVLLNPVYKELRRLADQNNDNIALSLAERMDAIPSAGISMDFKRYQYGNGELTDDMKYPPVKADFKGFHSYVARLDEAIRVLASASSEDSVLAKYNNVDVADPAAKKKELKKALELLLQKRKAVGQKLNKNADLFNEAVIHLYR